MDYLDWTDVQSR